MASVNCDRNAMDQHFGRRNAGSDRLKRLYPSVKEDKTPLPRAWSTKEKFTYIGLSQNNLRVHYKGHGKTHRDAASVQATNPIPASCGLYYFEVKIVSKGRDGYMGIGLSAQGVNMNRLPGWDKQSYGYHGDDGHSFCSSGTGQPYGPTFTTGDVIGCGVNLVDNTCFYTKNGHHLGIAFRDLPPNLYPTVGLQTPGEVVDANFGQEPFVFDIEDMMNELRTKTRLEIYNYPVPESQGEWQAILNKMVSTYLVHHGYCNTAESFAQITESPFSEDINSIKNRQKILKLVLAGRMGEAIERTFRLYPGLLENNQNLLFMLKCRQFVEMVNGSDIEICCTRKNCINSTSPPQTSVIQSTKCFSNNKKQGVEEMNQTNAIHKGNYGDSSVITMGDSDVEMEVTEDVQNGHGDCNNSGKTENGSTNGYQNGNSHNNDDSRDICHTCDNIDDEDMDVDTPCNRKASSKPAVERILEFGRELYSLSQRLTVDKISNDTNQKMLEDAFSLLAYSNPWASPVGWQLEPSERENICASLNSAILGEYRKKIQSTGWRDWMYARLIKNIESNNKPRRPPLEVAVAHAQELIRLMSANALGSCAFASLVDIMDQ